LEYLRALEVGVKGLRKVYFGISRPDSMDPVIVADWVLGGFGEEEIGGLEGGFGVGERVFRKEVLGEGFEDFESVGDFGKEGGDRKFLEVRNLSTKGDLDIGPGIFIN
jgi:hypothetical protein